MIRIYPARSMTGRVKEDVVKEAREQKEWLEKAGFEVLCPVIVENVKPTKEKLLSSRKAMEFYWPRDKFMIRKADVVFDMTPHFNSEGSKHEIGYARYHLWKPVIRIFPEGHLPPKSSVAYFEDDVVVDSIEEAVEWVLRLYGSPWKRFKWKAGIFKRCFLKAVWIRTVWFFDWI